MTDNWWPTTPDMDLGLAYSIHFESSDVIESLEKMGPKMTLWKKNLFRDHSCFCPNYFFCEGGGTWATKKWGSTIDFPLSGCCSLCCQSAFLRDRTRIRKAYRMMCFKSGYLYINIYLYNWWNRTSIQDYLRIWDWNDEFPVSLLRLLPPDFGDFLNVPLPSLVHLGNLYVSIYYYIKIR